MSPSPVASRHGAQLGIPPPSRAPPRAVLHPAPRRRAPCPCPVAVGRDVFARGGSPLTPPRPIARGGSPPRCVAWQVAHAESFAGASPCAPYRLPGLPARAGRDVRSSHPRHCRGTAPPFLPPTPALRPAKRTKNRMHRRAPGFSFLSVLRKENHLRKCGRFAYDFRPFPVQTIGRTMSRTINKGRETAQVIPTTVQETAPN